MSNNVEFSVGLPFLKCSSNPSQSINKKTNKKSKTATTKLILQENIDRIGQDPDIDTSKTYMNVFLSDIKSTNDYLEEIELTKQKINKELENKNYKKLRKDTVDNISLVVKPAFDCISQLDYNSQLKFLEDSKKCIENIFKNINSDFKFSVAVIHFDEISPHLHLNFMPLIFDEKKEIQIFNAKQFLSLKNITLLNKNYSKKMQELGWNVKDFNIYEKMTKEEKEEYRKQKKEYGKSSLEFKRDKLKELDEQIINKELIINKEIKRRVNEGYEKVAPQYTYDNTLKHYKSLYEEDECYIKRLHSLLAIIKKMSTHIPIIGNIINKFINLFSSSDEVNSILYNTKENEILKDYSLADKVTKNKIFTIEEQQKINEIENLNYYENEESEDF